MAVANLTDMSILATDPTLGNRILSSLEQFITTTVSAESITAANFAQHLARKNFGVQVLLNPTFYKPLFVNAVCSNQTVANDATAAGTLVGLTTTQVATAATSCTDTDINNAVASAYNSFIPGI